MKKIFVTTAGFLLAAISVPTIASASSITVKSGDTLFSIANKYNLSVNDLKTMNKLSDNTIKVGQTLVVSNTTVSTSPTVQKEYRNVVGAELLNVRKGPSTSYGIVGTLKKNTEVEVLSSSAGWYYVSTSNIKGYVYGTYLSIPHYNKIDTTDSVSGNTYIVKAGDTLWSIASAHNIDVNSLKSINKLTSNTVYVGQKLILNQSSTPETPASPSQDTNTISTYKVQAGDTLFSIASKFNMSVVALKSLNGISSNDIYVGQTLKTKETDSSQPSTTPSEETNTSTTYKVQSGDTLFSIANKFNMSVTTLKSLNGISSNSIYVGQILKVQGQASSTYGLFIHPAEGVLTSGFGPRWATHHDGIDIAKNGSVPVGAAADGTVSRSYLSDSYGEVVFIQHTINGQVYETVYGHMRSGSRAVQVGEKVKAGQFIGWMGQTGHATGQHLHFEVHKGLWNAAKSNAVDPELYVKY